MTVPLFAAETVLRSLTAADAPYAGTLCSGDPPTVWTDAHALPPAIWRAAAGGHLVVPREIARTEQGHVAALPHCVARLADRAGGGAGAAVTIAVSVARAADEATALGVDDGSWWIDDTGRPVLALGGGRPWRETAIALLGECAAAAGAPTDDAVNAVIGALESGAHQIAEECEDALFAAAVPAPLAPAPVAVPTSDALRASRRSTPAQQTAPSPLRSALARHVDGAIADRVGETLHRVRQTLDSLLVLGSARAARAADARSGALRPRSARGDARDERRERAGGRVQRDHSVMDPTAPERPRRRRAPVLVGATVAAAILAGGLLWPDPSSDASVARADTHSTGESSPAVPTPDPVAPDPESTAADPVARVLDTLAGCSEADSCAVVTERADTELPVGAATTVAPGRVATLLDDYGGVRAVRIDAEGVISQVVVLVARDDEWLVREVYDLAHQP